MEGFGLKLKFPSLFGKTTKNSAQPEPIDWEAQLAEEPNLGFEVSDGHCPCGGWMKPLVQSGRDIKLYWCGSVATALACTRCCHVASNPPTAEELDDYYRTEYGKGSESYYTMTISRAVLH